MPSPGYYDRLWRVYEDDPNNLGALLNLGLLYEEYYQHYPRALEFYQAFMDAPGGRNHEVAEDVERRLRVLPELLDALMELEGYTPPADAPLMCGP